jgi:hypothetical protein
MPRRFAVCSMIVATGLAALAAGSPARAADTAPSIVIPSRPGIPVVINGRDASYAVVEGDWGLARPGHMPLTVIGGSPIRPNPVYEPRNRYIPRYGRAPPRGRNEAEPPHAGAEPGNRSRATGRRRRTCRRPPASSIRQPIIDQTSSCLTTTDGAIVTEIVPRGHRGYPETDVKTKI